MAAHSIYDVNVSQKTSEQPISKVDKTVVARAESAKGIPVIPQPNEAYQPGTSQGYTVEGPSPAALVQLGPKRPRPHKLWQKRFVKILVVGDAGLGKTTMIRTLLSVPGQRLELHDGSETSADAFKRDPDSLCSRITWEDQEERIKWIYMIQDTPGYGDNLNIWNNITTMLRYVQDQNLRWLRLEQDKKRVVDLGEVEDPRVDICLFCLQPHRLRPIDLRFMLELGKVVPVVPVVMKADTMTIREAAAYRQEVYDKIHSVRFDDRMALGGCSGPIGLYEFSEAARERTGLKGHKNLPMPPFFVVASNTINHDLAHADPPVYWPERSYPWGTSQAFNADHSDILYLRTLLLHEAAEEISAAKRVRYHAWRRSELHSGASFVEPVLSCFRCPSHWP
eukprot:jgi/Botrbrau1/22602/Bobra.176_1s0032.1